MFTDIHTHILHKIDDGPESIEKSVELLNQAVLNGVKNIVATPHFYADKHSLNERINLAKERVAQLKGAIIQNEIPVSLISGFEVRYFEGISRIDSLNRLCINDSNFLLLELEPYPITERVVDDILNMSYAGYTVILAHIERYVKIPGFKLIKSLIAEGEVISQCNASSFISGSFQRAANRLLKEDMVSIIASDMHSVDMRPPNLAEAYKAIEDKFNSVTKERLIFKAEEIFKLCSGE